MPEIPRRLPPVSRSVLPHQLGWLRRPELDTEHGDVWEEPDGRLHIQPPGVPLRLNVFRAPVTRSR